MTEDQRSLWKKIQAFEVGDPSSEFSFVERLARENDWDLEYSLRAFFEYKRFMFLICQANHPLTPSDQVDQVWHLHLLYTESYWTDFCAKTLQRKIHHGPTKGGANEKTKFSNWYNTTVDLYTEWFGVKPPQDIWPEDRIRFGQLRFSRVNRHTHWVIPKPKFLKRWI
ncbi:MAG: hypothetical protein SchgKO_06340 [Schleiferiaceae bacterium]